MLIALNKQYGGYYVLNSDDTELRTSKDHIEAARKNPEMEVVEIPDNAYWVVSNYDGIETLYWSLSPINNV